jgi:tetratricopeptide (TPR) repeat protein
LSRLKSFLIAAAVAATVAAALWVGLNRRAQRNEPAAPAAEAPQTPIHEKASLEEQLKKKPGHAPVLLRLAQVEMELNNPADARKRLEELLRAEPANTEALLELGRVCYQLDDLPCALSETGKILAANPNQVDALYNMGAIQANMGSTGKAREYWTRAVKVSPDSESGRNAAAGLKQLGF